MDLSLFKNDNQGKQNFRYSKLKNNCKLAVTGHQHYFIMNIRSSTFFNFSRQINPFLLLVFLLAGCAPKKTLVEFQEGEKFGFKTIYGEVIIPPIYESTSGFYNGFNCVKKEGKWGALNEDGKMVIAPTYDDLSEFSEGISSAKQNGKYGFVDTKGKEIAPFIYEQVWYFENGMACVKKDGRWGFINTSGKVVIPLEYDDFKIPYFYEGLVTALKNGKWGFIDKNNKIVIPFDYEEVRIFSEGVAAVSTSYNKWGYIDHNNKVVLPFTYENPMHWDGGSFENGIAEVALAGKVGCINKKGETVIPFKYYSINPFYNGYAAVTIDNGAGIFSNSHAIVQVGYVDSTGKEYLEDNTDFTWHNWQVIKAPAELPDFSNLLKEYPQKPEASNKPSKYPDEVYIMSPDYQVVESVDSLGVISYSSVRPHSLSVTDSLNKYIADKKQQEEEEKAATEKEKTRQENAKWTLEKVLNLGLNAFTQEPKNYPDLNRLTEISIAYGLMLDGGNFGEHLIGAGVGRWDVLKKETIYKIISDENLRQSTWKWVAPYYKQSFMTLHPFHKKIYKDIASHLKNYINTYDVKKANAYLKHDERKFAQYDSDGKYNPYRKLCAFVDRLILVHKVISVADAKTWINKVADEVLSW
ncbi:MAG: repeat-containing protein [Bacteroidetes bacterium]|nr:repeat-containing protein [Bacteroidota bacterium]